MRQQPQEARAQFQRGSQFKWPQQRSHASPIEWPPVHEQSWPPARQHYAGDAPSSSPVPAPLYPQEGAWQQPFPTPLKPPARKAPKSKLPRPRRRKWRRLLLIAVSVMLLFGILLGTQLNGPFGAQIADGMRAVLGPTLTAQVESWFLGISDQAHQVQYQLSGQHVQPPWTTSHTRITNSGPQKIMPLVPLKPFITPALPGEGVWVTDGLPAPTSGLPPLVAKTFIRPDPARPYAVVTLLQFDMRFLALHMIAGTREPGGPRGVYGPGQIPAADMQRDLLLAAFNGGFKYADGQYGMYANGITYVPPQNGAATIAVTKGGQLIMGAWGKDPRLNSGNSDLTAWRQNASLLIDHSVVNSLANDGSAWGGTILNRTHTWRSGLGLTSYGSLIYAAGPSLSALTLGEALRAAGAITAMQTDINPFWVRAFLYDRSASGGLQITRLNPGMQGSGYEYLNGTDRDFFYLTRVPPPTNKP